MYELSITTHFAAAHRLREYHGDCENLHGHNWKVRVTAKSETLDDLGMAMDFRDLKRIVNGVLDPFDHAFLNDLDAFEAVNPTTENIARIVAEGVAAQLPEGVELESVTAWESENCSATYRP